MLINGDLVRIPQGTIVSQQGQKLATLPVGIVNHPQMAIVLDNDDKWLAKVLMVDEVVYVEKRHLQLVVKK
jgi:hypothetical protein